MPSGLKSGVLNWSLMAIENSPNLPRLNIPNTSGMIIGCSQQNTAVATKLDATNGFGVFLEEGRLRAVLSIPQTKGPIIGTGYDPPIVRTERSD